jgi:hypothetical protein
MDRALPKIPITNFALTAQNTRYEPIHFGIGS